MGGIQLIFVLIFCSQKSGDEMRGTRPWTLLLFNSWKYHLRSFDMRGIHGSRLLDQECKLARWYAGCES